MKAYLHSSRIAPKKAQIVAKMVRGMSVPKAIETLERTHKKAARLIEGLLKSAVANAQHNENQSADQLVVRTIVVNQGSSLRRGVPMARGRMRPMRKFMSHISITLGVAVEEKKEEKKAEKAPKKAEPAKKEVSKTEAKKPAAKAPTKKEEKPKDESESSSTTPNS